MHKLIFLTDKEQREYFLQGREDKFAGLELALTNDGFGDPFEKQLHWGDYLTSFTAFTLFSTEEGVSIANELFNLNRVKTLNFMFPQRSVHHIFKYTEYLMFFIEHSSITKWTIHSLPSYEFENFASPLHVASYHDYCEAIELLVKLGANVNFPDKKGDTPLHFAAKGCSVSAIECLLTHGADISKVNNRGKTALRMAKMSDSLCCSKYTYVTNLHRQKEAISLLKTQKKAIVIWDLWELTPNFVSYLQQLPLERMQVVIYLTRAKNMKQPG